eukprot:4614832-Prymnesium_polylepis.1
MRGHAGHGDQAKATSDCAGGKGGAVRACKFPRDGRQLTEPRPASPARESTSTASIFASRSRRLRRRGNLHAM